MADSEVRQKFEAAMAVITSDKGLNFSLCRNPSCGFGEHYENEMTAWAWTAYQAGMRAGEIAQREQSVFLAAKLLPVHMAKRLIAALPLPAAPEEKKP